MKKSLLLFAALAFATTLFAQNDVNLGIIPAPLFNTVSAITLLLPLGAITIVLRIFFFP